MSPAPQPLPGIAVFCASSLGNEKAFQTAAISLGKAIALAGRPLIYGSGTTGLMGVVSNAVLHGGGKVTGITPYAMFASGGEREKAHSSLGEANVERNRDYAQVETIIVNSMHERKYEMAIRSGGFVGLPGGFGTYDEVIEAVTWNQLDIHNKLLLNILSFYTPLKELIGNGVKAGFINPDSANLVAFVDGPSNLAEHEQFDWGSAALHALDTWKRHPEAFTSYDWSKKLDPQGVVSVRKEENI